MHGSHSHGRRIAVVGSGISGLSAAWLLSKRHDVTLFERDRRSGGHANTRTLALPDGEIAVDTGFIVYNEPAYPNFTALMRHLRVATQPSDMSLAISRGDGALEYAGGDLAGLFAQRRNIVRPRFWSMLRDLLRFYREAAAESAALEADMTLGDYLRLRGYGSAFRDDHLLPMAGAIWSAAPEALLDYPARSFIRFHHNHGLLQVTNRPQWRTVSGGSRLYVDQLTAAFKGRVRLERSVVRVSPSGKGVTVIDAHGNAATFDDVVMATHANEALKLLTHPTEEERRLLAAFRYTRNRAVLHSDHRLMPKRQGVWSSWNHVETAGGSMVTYWMNRLQGLPRRVPLFVTVNPVQEPNRVHYETVYDHPLFDTSALNAQKQLWSLQGARNLWFCGSYFGAGFHEDGLQSGLAVAEELSGLRRPWQVENESGRIERTLANSPQDLAA